MRTLRPASALVSVVCAACGGTTPAGRERPSPPPAVVVVVVDQLASWEARARWPLLAPSGGFARLLREAHIDVDVVLPYAATDTAPGHATLATGVLPTASGIAANNRIADDGASVSILRDDATELVGPGGGLGRAGSSLGRLARPTFADRLRARAPRAYIASFSLKDRAALPLGGRAPDVALYFDPRAGTFVTTSAVTRVFPAEFAPYAAPAVTGLRWELFDPTLVRAMVPGRDDAPGEGDLGGFGTTFPHVLGGTRAGEQFRTMPQADEALLAFARRAIALRRPAEPFLLALSFSAHDYAGHVFGTESLEIADVFVRLDGTLASLQRALDAAFGEAGWSMVLTADHGAGRAPEREGADDCVRADDRAPPCTGLTRIPVPTLAQALAARVYAETGVEDAILGVEDPYVVLRPSVRALPDLARREVEAAVVAALSAERGIVAAYATRDLVCTPGSEELALALLCASIDRTLGDVVFVAGEGAFMDSTYVPGYGGGHGSTALSDRTIPLVVRAPGYARGTLTPSEPTTNLDGFRLIDRLLGGDGAP